MRLAGFALLALAMAAGPARAADLALKRVMLSTAGVGYFEYEAEVSGDAELKLDLPLDEVDDVLKSVVVYDSAGGVGSASLPGREPLRQLLADLPFAENALASPATLLNALQGAEIRVGSSHPLSGKILKVVEEAERSGEVTTVRHRVSLLTASGLQQFILEDADSLAFADPALQASLDRALTAIASHRAKDRRELTLTTHGSAARTVRVGYVVGAPLWKASYRMSLPAGADAKMAHLQGWAVLENMSGQDWRDVELTLLSGNPVSFRQAIYEAYYVSRPEVPVEVVGRILPQADSRAEPVILAGTVASGAAMPVYQANLGRAPAAASALAEFAKAQPPAPPPAPMADTPEAEESATQVLFRIPVAVTLASGRSALVPIIDRDLPAERTALLQQGMRGDHPFSAVKLANDAASGLPPGVVTIYEASAEGSFYAGDARLPSLPAGETRFLSYAVDERTAAERQAQNAEVLSKVTAAEGVMLVTKLRRQSFLYGVHAPAAEPLRLIVEQAKLGNWRLVEPTGTDVAETATSYRKTVDLKPGESREIRFTFEYPVVEELRIADLDDARIGALISGRELSAAARQALAELARLRRAAAEKRSAQEEVATEIGALATDQARIRDNLASVDKESALHKRYIEKMSDQERRIEALQAAQKNAADERRAAEIALAGYIAKMSL